MKNKDIYISKISFICAVMVIALHSYGISVLLSGKTFVSTIGEKIISYISHGLATVAVPTFFFLSGYLLFKNVESLESLFRKLKKRVKTLLIPYICWNSLYFLFYAITGSSSIRTGNVEVDFSAKGIIEAILFHKYCYNLWFLLNLIVYTFVLSIPMIYLLKTKVVWMIWGIMLCMTLINDIKVDVILTDNKITIYSLAYCIYWMLGVMCSNKKKIYAGCKKSLIGYLILSIAVMFVKETSTFSNIECILVFANTICFLKSIEIWSSRMKTLSHNMNMILYGGAGFVQIIYTKVIFVMAELFSMPTILIVLLYLGEIILTVVICYFAGLFIKKYIPSVYFLLAGNR